MKIWLGFLDEMLTLALTSFQRHCGPTVGLFEAKDIIAYPEVTFGRYFPSYPSKVSTLPNIGPFIGLCQITNRKIEEYVVRQPFKTLTFWFTPADIFFWTVYRSVFPSRFIIFFDRFHTLLSMLLWMTILCYVNKRFSCYYKKALRSEGC